MRNYEQIEGTLFSSAFNTRDYVHVTLKGYFNLVESTKYQQLIGNVRALYAAHKTAEADTLKKQLALFVCGGVMEGGRRLEHLKKYSQIICADLDDVPGSPASILQQAFGLDYVLGGHISPSGSGVKLFIPVDSDLPHHALAFETVRRRLETDLPGITLDPSGKDPNRGCFVSYDPTAFLKTECEPLHVDIPPATTSKKRSVVAGSGSALQNYVDKFETGNAFGEGARHTFVVKLAAALNSAGFDQAETEAECIRRYALPDFTSAEIRETVTDIYSRYRTDFGTRKGSEKSDDKNEKAIKTVKTAVDTSAETQLPEGTTEEPDIEPDEALLPRFGEVAYESLPAFFLDILKPVTDPVERDVTLFSSLLLCSSTMPQLMGSLRSHEYQPPYYGIVLGESGSGKGCVSSLHRIVEAWQQYIYDNSRSYVKEYNKAREEYEAYKQAMRQMRSKGKPYMGPVVEEPEPVKQRNLHISGYTSAARMIEQLQDNFPYASCLFETEAEAVVNTLSQDYGGYGPVINQAAHHEMVGNSSKANGTFLSRYPLLTILLTGTPGMMKRLIPSTENGMFSRMLIYKIVRGGQYHPLTSADDSPHAAHYLDAIGQRLLDIAVHLEENPTWVKFTDTQRKRVDRFFEHEYHNVFVFGNEDMASTVLRYRLDVFRIAMTLTGIRKGSSRSTEKDITILNEDVITALEIVRVCLRHAFVVGTTLKRSKDEIHYKFPYSQQKLFSEMPETFKRSEMITEGCVRKISVSSVDRLLKKAEKYGLITSLGGGYFQKTSLGKDVKISDVP